MTISTNEKTVKGPTEAEILEDIIGVMSEGNSWGYDPDVYAEYAAKKLDQLTRKKEKAREVAAAKRAEGDELGAAVKAVLTDKFQIAEKVLEKIDTEQFPEVSLAKVRYRLRTMDGVECSDVRVELDGKTKSRKAYRLVQD